LSVQVHCEKCTSQEELAEPLNSHYRQLTLSKSICYSAALPYITLFKHANVLIFVILVVVPSSKLHIIVEIVLTSKTEKLLRYVCWKAATAVYSR